MIVFNKDAEWSDMENKKDVAGKIVGWRQWRDRAVEKLKKNYDQKEGVDCSNDKFHDQKKQWATEQDKNYDEAFCRSD